ncbi:MAG: T9SS type A sorting domain-containing protein [Bacteroidia bacterium]|jgi:hypothetical protein|nr:T9SS type A sorting domain-containing protein [Bacteroidia bacterium]
MKIKVTTFLAAIGLTLSSYAQFFDSVPYRGAFAIAGTTKAATTGYNPDPTNTGANWATGWTNWSPNTAAYPGDAGWSPTAQFPAPSANKVVVSGNISSNTTWTKNNWYELTGTVHVTNGATLTIEPGTVIRGNITNIGVLIIAKGGKLNAIGTKEQPIVFTSNKAQGSRLRGDWGGLLLIGNAQTNTPGGVRQYEALPNDPLANYGGGANPNNADNSGTLRYIRIEYAGFNFLPDQEINGLTFAGVGSGTRADYIQVSFANDDSYEWFGGTSNHKYLIAYAGTDDDFDMDEGYAGKLQYLLGVRNPAIFETSPSGTSNGLEHDNNTGLGTASQINPATPTPTPTTSPIISNMTLVGPIKAGANRTSLSTTANARFGRGLELRTNVSTSIFNSIVWGYSTLFQFGNPTGTFPATTQTRAVEDQISMRNNVFISTATGNDIRFNSQNGPSSYLASNNATFNLNTAWMRDWLINASPIGFTGPTGTDTARTTLTAGVEMVNPVYSGTTNGSLAQLDFSAVDFTLAASSPFNGTSSFRHPKIATIPTPSISVDPSSLPVFNKVVDAPSEIRTIFISAANLAGNITINAPANFLVSFNRNTGYASSINKNGPSASDTVFIQYTRNTTGGASGFVSISSTVPTDFTTINIAVLGNTIAPAAPFVGVSAAALTFNSALTVPSTERTLTVYGKYLTANAVVIAPSGYEVTTTSGSGYASTVSLTTTDGNINASVFVRYTPTVAGNTVNNLKIAVAGLDTVSVTLNGSTPVSMLTSSVTSYPQWQIVTGDSSLAYPITVSGVNLTDSVRITAPNANFQLSVDSAFTTPSSVLFLNTSESATLAATKVFVRFKGATSTGNVSIASAGAATVNVAVSGSALSATARRILVNSPTNSFSFSATLGTPSASQTFTVQGFRLTDTIGLAFSVAGFELSTNNTTWSSTLRLDTIAGGSVPSTQIWVRYNPAVAGASGAQQLIVNSPGATNVTFTVNGLSSPGLVVTPAVLPTFATVVGTPSISIPVNVSGSRLISDVIVTASSDFQVSLDSLTDFASSVTATKTGSILPITKVFVRYNPAIAGSSPVNSVLTVSTQSTPNTLITLNGFSVQRPTPVINLGVASLPEFETNIAQPTAPQSFIINAVNLTDSLSITVGGDFELSPDSINYKKDWKVPAVNGSISNLRIFCRLNRTDAGITKDTILVSSTGAITGKIAVSGKSTVGIVEHDNITSFVMYPNPAKTELIIDFVAEQSAITVINVYDLAGKLVKNIANDKFAAGHNAVFANIADLQDGFYLVSVQSLQGSKTVRLLISK